MVSANRPAQMATARYAREELRLRGVRTAAVMAKSKDPSPVVLRLPEAIRLAVLICGRQLSLRRPF